MAHALGRGQPCALNSQRRGRGQGERRRGHSEGGTRLGPYGHILKVILALFLSCGLSSAFVAGSLLKAFAGLIAAIWKFQSGMWLWVKSRTPSEHRNPH